MRLEFLEKFLANNFALSEAEGNTSGRLNREGIADLLFLRTLSATEQKSLEPSFSDVMNPFVLLAYASLAASRTFLQRLLACHNFTLNSENLFYFYKRKKVIPMNWQRNKQLKTMEMRVRFDVTLMMRDKF